MGESYGHILFFLCFTFYLYYIFSPDDRKITELHGGTGRETHNSVDDANTSCFFFLQHVYFHCIQSEPVAQEQHGA